MTTEMREWACRTCYFYDNRGGTIGSCRAHAPTKIDEEGRRVFPSVYASDYCGEWKEAKDE